MNGIMTTAFTAGLVPVIANWTTAVLADTVYRCPGNVYQDIPRTAGTAPEIDPLAKRIGKAPSIEDRMRAEKFVRERYSGPAVHVLPIPPRMVTTPPAASTPSIPIWIGWPYWFQRPYGSQRMMCPLGLPR